MNAFCIVTLKCTYWSAKKSIIRKSKSFGRRTMHHILRCINFDDAAQTMRLAYYVDEDVMSGGRYDPLQPVMRFSEWVSRRYWFPTVSDHNQILSFLAVTYTKTSIPYKSVKRFKTHPTQDVWTESTPAIYTLDVVGQAKQNININICSLEIKWDGQITRLWYDNEIRCIAYE